MASFQFDDSRIKDHPDKKLLEDIRTYFKAFTGSDFEGMRDGETEDYTMTDISLGIVRASRDTWYDINKNFVGLLSELRVIALTLYGSSEAGAFSVLEHVVLFRLTADPPPESAVHLPRGAKAGDEIGMINVAIIWWNGEGKISRELEYGRLTWPDFDVGQFDGPGPATGEIKEL